MTQNVVSAGMDLAGVLPRFLDIRRSGIVMCVLGILVQPWRFVNTASTFVSVVASFGGMLVFCPFNPESKLIESYIVVFVAPMTGILVVDYWVIRRHKLIIPDLYSSKGIYWFHWGLNWRAFLVFFVCTAPSMRKYKSEF